MKTVVPYPSPEQVKQIQKALAQDRNSNFSRLEYFLKQIVVNRDVSFPSIGDDELVEITPQNIRIRKTYLTEIAEKQAKREGKGN